MTAIKNVAVVGATGHLGPSLVEALLVSGKFNITVLARQSSAILKESPFPASVAVVATDFSSLSSLTEALKTQDAVICSLPSSSGPILSQKLIVEAAIAVGVSHFFPSDFGSDTDNALSKKLPLFAPKAEFQAYLEEIVEVHPKFSYSLVRTNAFLDMGLRTGFLTNVKGGDTTVFGAGDQLFSTTTRETIGKAIVAILENPEDFKNRPVYIHDIAISQRQLIEIAKKVHPERVWNEKTVDLRAMEKAVSEGKGGPRDSLVLSVWGDGYGGHFKKVDNELLGLGLKSLKDVEALVVEIS